jgi:hypothetical protein
MFACADGQDETDSKANATKTEAPVLPKFIKKTIQVTRKKTYHVSTDWKHPCMLPGPEPISVNATNHSSDL